MQIILLVEPKHLPIPDSITVVKDYGEEAVIPYPNIEVKPICGISMLLSGESQDFVNWLSPFDGVWLCDQPLLGEWNVYHIALELIGD